MPFNPLTRLKDTDLLMPLFQTKVLVAVRNAQKAGHPIDVFETWRSPTRQDALYAQGREPSKPGPKVTNAKAWESFHNYGVACDIAAKVKGQWSWQFDADEVIPFFLREGLESLRPYEACHFQLTGGISIKDARKITFSHGLQALWLEINRALLPPIPKIA